MSWFLDIPVQQPTARVHDNIQHDAGDFQTGCVWLYVCYFYHPQFSTMHGILFRASELLKMLQNGGISSEFPNIQRLLCPVKTVASPSHWA